MRKIVASGEKRRAAISLGIGKFERISVRYSWGVEPKTRLMLTATENRIAMREVEARRLRSAERAEAQIEYPIRPPTNAEQKAATYAAQLVADGMPEAMATQRAGEAYGLIKRPNRGGRIDSYELPEWWRRACRDHCGSQRDTSGETAGVAQ